MSKIGDYFASQCGNPHGLMGAILTKSMNKANRVLYDGIVFIYNKEGRYEI